ncbi:flagellar assembly peptidoglycan hydrolase FlgJ [Idiomarina tyrosinivorans]|uniref:Peptidoglycan hydrolase FlgJ n=1 Tax=Idiomarina tyrosinivorans TaxID=1445662 RepID=A0A432ZPK7_9GAMM|nr:flagellar assembly peptidoglycan hydrolase FlgJ [Idiomarina tyrosinivorans]RUO79834.1 flagellar assembly peptidoglycan hydrolase FlgJ [Idiomarina tyrosinivorans]
MDSFSKQTLQQAQSVMDGQGLEQLRRQAFANKNDEAALRKAAQQFEAVFMNMLMSSMRKANAVFEQGNPMHSRYTDMYRDMRDQQLTSELSNTQALGLADLIVQQLKGGVVENTRANIRPGAELGDVRQASVARPTDAGLFYGSQRVSQARISGQAQQFTSPEAFVESLRPAAEKVAEKNGLSADALIAQAALETGWGKHIVPGRHGGSSNNLFNIKADPRWEGDRSHVTTLEHIDGITQKQQAAFRSYNDVEQSLQDYVDFLRKDPRYASALAVAKQPDKFAEALQDAGYATDPQYAQKIRKVMANPAVAGK